MRISSVFAAIVLFIQAHCYSVAQFPQIVKLFHLILSKISLTSSLMPIDCMFSTPLYQKGISNNPIPLAYFRQCVIPTRLILSGFTQCFHILQWVCRSICSRTITVFIPSFAPLLLPAGQYDCLPQHAYPKVWFTKIARRNGHTGDSKTFEHLRQTTGRHIYAAVVFLFGRIDEV